MTIDILVGAMIDLARNDFYYYCRFRLPQIYTEKRPHLRKLCNELQWFIEQDEKENLIINMPPRHGKTLTVELLTEWVLGKNPSIGIMTACYNETLATRFSKAVRGAIQEKSVKIEKPTFSQYFPNVKIKKGDGAMQLWALEGSHFSFLATSPTGTMTGIGCQLLIIDDLIKNAEESNNPRVLEDHWDWYNNTVLSRIENGGKQIVIQTRWNTNDLSGKLLAFEPDKWHVIKMKAQNEDGTMLCPDMLNKEKYEERKSKTDPIIIAGNYQQEPYDSIDKLYQSFRTYYIDQIPDKFERIEAYFDTADKGSDSLAGLCYGISKGYAYVLDILFTAEGMEITEIKASRMLDACNSNTAWIESNNGGEGWGRNVDKKLRELGNNKTTIKSFHQSGNKEARILTNSFSVQNSILFPIDWRNKWPLFAKELESMGRSEKWKHDDAADALTGIIEKSLSKAFVFM